MSDVNELVLSGAACGQSSGAGASIVASGAATASGIFEIGEGVPSSTTLIGVSAASGVGVANDVSAVSGPDSLGIGPTGR